MSKGVVYYKTHDGRLIPLSRSGPKGDKGDKGDPGVAANVERLMDIDDVMDTPPNDASLLVWIDAYQQWVPATFEELGIITYGPVANLPSYLPPGHLYGGW